MTDHYDDEARRDAAFMAACARTSNTTCEEHPDCEGCLAWEALKIRVDARLDALRRPTRRTP